MRKIIITMLAAAALVALAAQPAAADNPYASHWVSIDNYQYWGGEMSNCQTPNASGVNHQYGAWGYFVDGCTTRTEICQRDRCWFHAMSEMTSTLGNGYDKRTQNARTRVYRNSGGPETSHMDQSCAAYYAYQRCTTDYSDTVWRGQAVTIQCNGVHSDGSYGASNKCTVDMQKYY